MVFNWVWLPKVQFRKWKDFAGMNVTRGDMSLSIWIFSWTSHESWLLLHEEELWWLGSSHPPGHCRYLVSFLLVWHGSAMERERERYIYIFIYPLIIFLYRFLALLVVLDTCGNPTHQKLTTLWSAKPGSWWLLFHIQIGRDCIVTYCILWKK